MFKKCLAVCFCVLMLCGVLCVAASAAASVTYTVQTIDKPIKAGEEFTVTVSISKVDALACVECKLRYDKTVLTALSATKGDFLSACLMGDTNIAPQVPETKEPDKYGEVWITGFTTEDRAASGVLTTITFKANKDITSDTAIEIFKTPIASKITLEEYVCFAENGGVKGSGSSTTATTKAPVTPDGSGTVGTTLVTNESDVTAPTTPSDETTTTVAGATPTDEATAPTTENSNSIQAPSGELTPMETTTVAAAVEKVNDNSGTVITVVAIVVGVALLAVAAALLLKRKKSQ